MSPPGRPCCGTAWGYTGAPPRRPSLRPVSRSWPISRGRPRQPRHLVPRVGPSGGSHPATPRERRGAGGGRTVSGLAASGLGRHRLPNRPERIRGRHGPNDKHRRREAAGCKVRPPCPDPASTSPPAGRRRAPADASRQRSQMPSSAHSSGGVERRRGIRGCVRPRVPPGRIRATGDRTGPGADRAGWIVRGPNPAFNQRSTEGRGS